MLVFLFHLQSFPSEDFFNFEPTRGGWDGVGGSPDLPTRVSGWAKMGPPKEPRKIFLPYVGPLT